MPQLCTELPALFTKLRISQTTSKLPQMLEEFLTCSHVMSRHVLFRWRRAQVRTMSERVFHAGGFHPAQTAAQLQTCGGTGGEQPGGQPRGQPRGVDRQVILLALTELLEPIVFNHISPGYCSQRKFYGRGARERRRILGCNAEHLQWWVNMTTAENVVLVLDSFPAVLVFSVPRNTKWFKNVTY